MKFSTACAVLAAFAAAAAPARAGPLVSITLSTLGETFSRLINTQTNIKTVEKRNVDFVSHALNGISRELHQGLDSKIFQIGSGIRTTLVDVNLKVGQISGNATSIISQFQSVAQTVSTLQFSDARLDYDIKKNRIKKLCEDILAMTNVVLQLIDETKEMLNKGVNGPIKMLQLTIQLTSDNMLVRERANIAYQQSIIDNPPSKWSLLTDYDAVNTARALKQKGSDTIERINTLVTSILNHAKWLESECQTMRKNLDNDRTTISSLEGKISGASGSIAVIADGFDFLLADSRNMSDNRLKEGSKALVQLMSNLKDQVSSITIDHARKATESYDYIDTATKTYQGAPGNFPPAIVPRQMSYNNSQIFNTTRDQTRNAVGSYEPHRTATEDFSPAVFLEQPVKPSWLDKAPVNSCYYIYNNRTTGCISAKTFEYMKQQYTSLSNKFMEHEAFFKAYENRWKNLTTQVLNVSKDTFHQHQLEASKLVTDFVTRKLLWSVNINKLRELSVSLNFYAESLFSEANAQLNITRSNDDTLNEDIMRVVDDNKITAMSILKEIENDIFVINNQEAGIRHSPLFQV